jgi:CBS domain-containing protein
MEPPKTAADYMTRTLVVLKPDMDLHRALQVLLENDISGAPVVDHHGALVGILTEKDCFRAAVQASYHRELAGPVSDFMSHPVETLDADTDIVTVIEKFLESPYRRFPVVAGSVLAGQLSRKDVLRAVRELW